MTLDPTSRQQLRQLPGIDRLLESARTRPDLSGAPRTVVAAAGRLVVEALRARILAGGADLPEDQLTPEAVLERVAAAVHSILATRLHPVVNATGVVVHTNLGRSLLAPAALDQLAGVAGRYSNLELNLATGRRGSRYDAVADLLCEITGAEAALVVNNNAAAVLLCLETLAHGRAVIVSRGELVEIGGSFRIPDVMAKSGARLREVGTTNRTHLRDYEAAIDTETALLLKVHRSNFAIVGFTREVPLAELVRLGARMGHPVMEDLGSGTFIDFARYGLQREPTVQDSVAAGADVITFSGDKLLGGPQAGVILGRRDLVDRIKANPLNRALRIDKLTLAALEATLRLYRDEAAAVAQIPTLRMIVRPAEELEADARRLAEQLEALDDPRLDVRVAAGLAKAGGGALPLLDIPSRCVHVRFQGLSATALDQHMRRQTPPIMGRIEDDIYRLDVRTLQPGDDEAIIAALRHLTEGAPS
jgi:L-seryl-tRNA(Ser) seleniumtransferase